MKKLLTALFVACLCSLGVPAIAQSCMGPICTAASPAESDVLAALPSTGNPYSTVVVNIPGGTAAWTSQLTYSIPPGVTDLTVKGATTVNCTGGEGTSSYTCTKTDLTIIQDNVPGNFGVWQFFLNASSSFRFTGITFNPGTGGNKAQGDLLFYTNSNVNPATLRIDHNHFNLVGGPTGWAGRLNNCIKGVADHNVFDNASPSDTTSVYQDLMISNTCDDALGSGDGSWAVPTAPGSSNAFFLESNVVNGGLFVDCAVAGRYVARYNTLNSDSHSSSWIHTHGTQQNAGRVRGCRSDEVYHNYFNSLTANAALVGLDGGSGLVWGNTSNHPVIFAGMGDERNDGEHPQTATPGGWGYCGINTLNTSGPTSNWDGNADSTGWPCLDGLGRGQGTQALNGANFPNALNSATGTIAWTHEYLEPVYLWMNTLVGGSTLYTIGGPAPHADRDVYGDNAAFNGLTGGTGYGPLANRPLHCTPGPGGTYATSPGGGSRGVAYFSTDDNGGTGELYVCTSTDVWTPTYQPYPWPHPLTLGTTETPQAATPTFSPASGIVPQTVSISDATAGAAIHYTTDGTTPTTSSSVYSGPISVLSAETLNAIAVESGYLNSAVGTATYTINALPAPIFSQRTGTYLTLPSVTFTLPGGATGCYTLDNTTPTGSAGACSHGTAYSGAVTIPSSGTTLKAIATQGGSLNSEETDATYTLALILLDSGGVFDGGSGSAASLPVTLNVATAGEGITCETVYIGTFSSLTDNRNAGAYSVATPLYSAIGANTELFYKSNVAAGLTTITLALTAPEPNSTLACQAWEALGGTFTLDSSFVQQQHQTSASNPTTGSAKTPSYANELIIGDLMTNNLTNPAAGTNYTMISPTPDGPQQFPEYWIQTAATATNAPYVLALDEWVDQMAGFAFLGAANPAATPTFSPSYGVVPQTVSIADATFGSTIYYTTDGTTPTTSSSVYSTPLYVTSAKTVKAIAVASGYTQSSVASASFTTMAQAAAPIEAGPNYGYNSPYSYSPVSVAWSDSTPGASIRCTLDGSAPTGSSTLYTGPISITVTTVIRCFAQASGYSDSAPTGDTWMISLPTAATPGFSLAAGTYTGPLTLTLTDGTSGAAIHYTTNGTTPTAASALYTGPITVSASETVEALAVASGYQNSSVASAVYTINIPVAAIPTCSPAVGSYTSVQNVTLSDNTYGSSIYYTVNGTNPTAGSTLYSGPIVLSSTTTVKAMAVAGGYQNSGVASCAYTINIPVVATPGISPNGGTFTTTPSVTLTDSTPSSSIYYTTNGSTPTSGSTLYSGTFPVSSSMTVKAIGIVVGDTNSAVASATFTINLPTAATPTLSPAGGNKTGTTSVTLHTTTPGGVIHYTTNGSTPTASSTVYTVPFPISSTTTVRAITVATNYLNSAVGAATYNYKKHIVSGGLKVIGALSIKAS